MPTAVFHLRPDPSLVDVNAASWEKDKMTHASQSVLQQRVTNYQTHFSETSLGRDSRCILTTKNYRIVPDLQIQIFKTIAVLVSQDEWTSIVDIMSFSFIDRNAMGAAYSVGLITCPAHPFDYDVACIFSWRVFHSATAGIYYHQDQTAWEIIFLIRGGVGEELIILVLITITIFPSHSLGLKMGLKCIHSHRTSHSRLLATTKTSTESEKWQHLSEEACNDCLHCWNSGFTSWVCPHPAGRQHMLPPPHPPFIKIICRLNFYCWDITQVFSTHP